MNWHAVGRGVMMQAPGEFIGGTPDAGEYQRVGMAPGQSQDTVDAALRRLRLRCRELIMSETVATNSQSAF